MRPRLSMTCAFLQGTDSSGCKGDGADSTASGSTTSGGFAFAGGTANRTKLRWSTTTPEISGG